MLVVLLATVVGCGEEPETPGRAEAEKDSIACIEGDEAACERFKGWSSGVPDEVSDEVVREAMKVARYVPRTREEAELSLSACLSHGGSECDTWGAWHKRHAEEAKPIVLEQCELRVGASKPMPEWLDPSAFLCHRRLDAAACARWAETAAADPAYARRVVETAGLAAD